MTRIGVLIAALVLVTSVPAAGADAPVLVGAQNDGSIVSLSSSGALLTTLVGRSPFGIPAGDPVWSPDGTRIAFVRSGIWVADLDGATQQLTVPSQPGYDTQPVWSPDGSQVAFLRSEAGGGRDVFVVGVADGRLRRLTSDAAVEDQLSWQPRGSMLLFLRWELDRGSYVADTVTGTVRRLARGVSSAGWSPDGRAILSSTADGLEIAAPDGSRRRVLVRRPAYDGTWSPDGRRIAFTLATLGPPNRFGTPAIGDVYVVDADGSGLRRLTGVDGDSPSTRGTSASGPRWWPGGARLFYASSAPTLTGVGSRIWTMNADGSCEAALAQLSPQVVGTPSWSPTAPAQPATECSSALVRLRTERAEVGKHDPVALELIVRNDGTRPLADARVTVEASRGTVRPATGSASSCTSGPTLVCPLGSFAPGAALTLELVGTPSTAGVTEAYMARIAWQGEGDVNPDADVATAAVTVAPCDIVGTWGNDKLTGTARGDRICGRPGADRIGGGAGNDVIEAGSGADTVVGGPGRDTIDGGGGTDVVFVRDGERDVIDCGSEEDVVVADQRDVLKRCEHVTRAKTRPR